MRSRLIRDHGALLCLAMAALCVVVIRACLQSITLDEAGSFLSYARKPWPSQWWPLSDNHVLNSLLMRLVTTVFGVSDLTARLPAVLGAFIYIGSAVCLVLLMCQERLLRCLVFICLVYNPLVLDYLVAARGYSLATGLLLVAIALIASIVMRPGSEAETNIFEKVAWLSVLLALSCAANFSFAIANGTTLTVFVLWAARHRVIRDQGYTRLAAFSYLPGIIAGFLICGSVLLNWPKGELYFGSKHLSEMWSGFASGSFDELNPNMLNPLVLSWLAHTRGVLAFATPIVVAFLLALMEITRRRMPNQKANAVADFVRLIVIVSGITLLLHWLAFKSFHLPLPKDRTGLFFIPLWTLALSGPLAFRSRFGIKDAAQYCGIGFLVLVAFYFIGCLRLGYFKEWRFDSDTKQLYWIMEGLRDRCGITKFGTDWRYHLPLNFYREVYDNTSLREFSGSSSGELPADRDAYALFLPTSEDFIRQQRLNVIYHNDVSDAAVAIRSCPAQGRSD